MQRLISRPTNPAKAYLQRYRAALARYQSLARSIVELRETLTGTTQALRPDPVSGGGGQDRMAGVVARIADMEAELSDALADLDAQLRQTVAAIEAVPDETQRAVLTLRYIEGMDWNGIQGRLNYEKTQIFVIHGRALVAVNRWLESADENGL